MTVLYSLCLITVMRRGALVVSVLIMALYLRLHVWIDIHWDSMYFGIKLVLLKRHDAGFRLELVDHVLLIGVSLGVSCVLCVLSKLLLYGHYWYGMNAIGRGAGLRTLTGGSR